MSVQVVKPRIRGFICTNAHPAGCQKNVQEQIDYIKTMTLKSTNLNALVIGASTGYGLASRYRVGVALRRQVSRRLL